MAIINSIIDLSPLTSSLNQMGDDVRDLKSKIEALEIQNQTLLSQNQSILQALEALKERIERLQANSERSLEVSMSQTSPVREESIEGKPIQDNKFSPKNIYFGSPQSLGFAISDEINSIDNPKALYEVCVNSEDSATFHVLTSKYPRLQLNVTSLLSPVCQVEGEAESSSQIVVISDGELQKKEKMWCLVKPCVVKFQ